jgi:hypothetical protein
MGPEGRDQFDDLLDGALKHYGDVEPRVGLEGRVLARLPSGRPTPVRWTAVLAGVCISALTVGVWWGLSPRKDIPRFGGAVTPQELGTTQPNPPTAIEPGLRPAEHKAIPIKAGRRGEPKLPQFPSMRVLSRQELAMASYVERFPKEAALIAQEQRSFEDEIRETEKAAGLDRPTHDSER